MAYTPISKTVPQYYASGVAASGYYLKYYVAGTTTALSMAIDAAGSSTLAKCQINSEGHPINGSSAIFIPHLNADYKEVLYTTEADADADATGSAHSVIDNITSFTTYPADRVTFTASGTGTVARTMQEKATEARHIKDFGVTADGVANDSTAMALAISSAKANGHGLTASADDIIHFGTYADSGVQVKMLIDFDNFTFDTNNCKFTANISTNAAHAMSNNQILFEITGSNCTIGDFSVTGDSVVKYPTAERKGMTAIWIYANGANNRQIKIGRISGENLYTGVIVSSSDPATYRTRGITIDDSFFENIYYGLNCAENGDFLTAKIASNLGVRTYFSYGFFDHDIDMYTTNTDTESGSFNLSQCLISRYTRDTEKLRISYSATGDGSSGATINFNHVHDDSDATIRNVRIDCDVTKDSNSDPVINFATFEADGTPEYSSSGKTFDDIRLSGRSTNTSSDPLVFTTAMSGGAISRIFLDQHFMAAFSGPYKEYQVFRDETTMIVEAAPAISVIESGTHTGTSGQATVLTDSTAAYDVNALYGYLVKNTTDGSSGEIISNTATTITVAALSGGTDNDWDNGDAYTVNAINNYLDIPVGHLQLGDRLAKLTVIARNDITAQTGLNFRMEEFWVNFVCASDGTVTVHSYTSKNSLEEDTGAFNPSFFLGGGAIGTYTMTLVSTTDSSPGYSGANESIKCFFEVYDWLA